MKTYLLIICLVLAALCCLGQQNTLDIPGIHQLVDQSTAENKLQVQARNQQALASANEQANLTLLAKMKSAYRDLQHRFNSLGTAINLADLGIYATPAVQRIIRSQSQIIRLAAANPALISAGFLSELQFAAMAKSLLGYVAGLTLSLGDVNQMKASDRKILFDYVLSELSRIDELSSNMAAMMASSSLAAQLRAANPFQNFINADKSISLSIIQNAKYIK